MLDWHLSERPTTTRREVARMKRHFTADTVRTGHYVLLSACGKNVTETFTTQDTEAVDCGNCKRSQAFKDAAKSGIEILAGLLSLDNGTTPATIETIPTARSRYADAGFFTGYTGSNRQTFQNFRITAIFPDGSSEVTATGHNGTLKLASLTDFLMWITPQGMHIGRILDAVIGDGMTWIQAMDLEYALTAECESVDAIEYAVNDALMQRIRNLAVGSRVMVSGEMATVVQVRGTEAMVKLDTPDSRDGSHIVIPAEDTLIERIKATTDRIHATYLRDLRNLVSRPVRTNLARRARKADKRAKVA